MYLMSFVERKSCILTFKAEYAFLQDTLFIQIKNRLKNIFAYKYSSLMRNQVIPFLNKSVRMSKAPNIFRLFTCLGAFLNISQFTV